MVKQHHGCLTVSTATGPLLSQLSTMVNYSHTKMALQPSICHCSCVTLYACALVSSVMCVTRRKGQRGTETWHRHGLRQIHMCRHILICECAHLDIHVHLHGLPGLLLCPITNAAEELFPAKHVRTVCPVYMSGFVRACHVSHWHACSSWSVLTCMPAHAGDFVYFHVPSCVSSDHVHELHVDTWFAGVVKVLIV